jgi:hypothetical protein
VFHRDRIALDGQWEFWTDPENELSTTTLNAENRIQITVPSPLQIQSPDLNHYSGAAWYQRELGIPAGWLEGKPNKSAIILGIDAADYAAEVWLNGVKVGEHEGGYLPFELDATAAAVAGSNILTVRIDDPPSLFPEIPHGKQGWYGPLSGIWQSVWLERRPNLHIRSMQIHPDPDQGCVEAQVILSASDDSPFRLVARVIDPFGELAASTEEVFPSGKHGVNFALEVTQHLLWSPDSPHLYHLEVQVEDGQGAVDVQSKHFGFRKIEAREGKLYLNGQFLYLRGALDQDYYLETIYTTPDLAFLEDQIHKAKELGLNCLRCHIKVADPRYYDVADRLGMLIWTELPNWSVFTPSAGQRGRDTLQGILARDGHHPSIIVWTIINENWGTDLVNDRSHRAWLKDTYRWLKGLDPTRLVVDNSPCLPNFHIQTDLEDFHFYRAIPDQRTEWDQFVQEFASRPEWTFCPNGDKVRTGQEPLIVSEFGNWGLPDADLLVDPHGRDPWWFGTGYEWSQGVVYPEGVRQRFNNLGLQRVFGSWKKFVEATQWQQYLALKYQIEAMRLQPEISGYVITELTDVHWECNGLLDMRRNPKAFHQVLKNFNAGTVIIPKWERVSYWSGEMVKIGISISHGTSPALGPAELTWSLSSGNVESSMETPAMQEGKVLQVGEISFQAPELAAPQVVQLKFELRSAEGELIAINTLDLSLFPQRCLPDGAGRTRIYTPDQNLAERLKDLGYSLAESLDQADLAVVSNVDDALLDYMGQGGRLLVLADRAVQNTRTQPALIFQANQPPSDPAARSVQIMPGIRMEARQGTPWIGDWASAFSWVGRKGPFDRLPGGPLIEHSFDRVIPVYVLVGFRDWDFRSLVHAGIVVGWVHKPAVMIGERYYGKGRAVLNTFRLDDAALGTDPTAIALFDGLIELALRK